MTKYTNEERIELLEVRLALVIEAAQIQNDSMKIFDREFDLMNQRIKDLERKIDRMQRDVGMN